MKHRKTNFNSLVSIIILSVFITIYFNFFIFYQLAFGYAILTFVGVFSIVALMLSIISFNRIVFLFFYIIIIVIFSYTFFFAYFHRLYPSTRAFNIIAMLDIEEVMCSIDFWVTVYVLLSLLLSLLIWKYVRIDAVSFLEYIRNFILIFFICLPCFYLYLQYCTIQKSKQEFQETYSFVEQNIIPINIIDVLSRYILYYNSFHNYKLIDIDTKSHPVKIKKELYDDVNVILVLGETSRKVNWALSGYERDTNPKLSKIDNLVYFKNFYSGDTYTLSSNTCILSMEECCPIREEFRKKKRDLQFSTFIQIFNQLGYNSYLISNVPRCQNDPGKIMMSNIENTKTFSEKNIDHTLLIPLKDIKRDKSINKKRNKLIIIQTLGSHDPYSKQYSNKFKKFIPTCEDASGKNYLYCKNEHLVNEYDNTILSTDDFLSQIIELFQDTKTILIYTSDHGESLGEKGVYLHGALYSTAPKEQIEVPTFIWFSTPFLDKFGEDSLDVARKKIDQKMDHEYISHSILDCAFISSDIINLDKSFCAMQTD